MSKIPDRVYYRIGREWGPRIGFTGTLQEVGDEFGMSKQNAVYYCNIALGKVIYRLLKLTKEKRDE